ncbi:MAG: hypothetical protein IKU37_02915, partial [Candidatus Gastranaerophilales bacterium]|nr:hypothetical protein [Candidatus Gastranaerophilales bacterium]
AEIGVDASLSLLADLVITGEIDLTSEGWSQFLGILTSSTRAKLDNMKTSTNAGSSSSRTNETAIAELARMTNADGSPRFDGYDIGRLAEIYAGNEIAIAELAEMTNADGSARFNGYEIAELVKIYAGNETAIAELAKITNADGSPRFIGCEIAELVKIYADNKTTIDELAKITNADGSPRFEYYETAKLAKIYVGNETTIDELAKITNADGSPRFSGYEIAELAKIYAGNEIAIAELARMTNANGSARFKGTNITEDFINFYATHKNSLKRVLNIKNTDGEYLIDNTNIKELLETYAKYPNELVAILDLVNTQGENIVRDLPSIQRLAKYMHEEPQLEIPRFLMHLRQITNLENNPLEFNIRMLQCNGGYLLKARRSIVNKNTTNENNKREISRFGNFTTYEYKDCKNFDTNATQQVITLLEDGNIIESTGICSKNSSFSTTYQEIYYEPRSYLDLLDIDSLDLEDSNKPKPQTKYSCVKIFEEHQYQGSSTIMSKTSNDIVDYQIEIINSTDGQPSHILYTRSSNILDGAYNTTRYDLSNYPEDFDILSALKDGSIDEVIKTNGYPEGIKLSSISQDGNITNYNESYERNGLQTIRSYSQEVNDGGRIISTNYTYNIIGANEETLASINRSWKQNPDGTTTTIINGKEYQAKFNDKTLEIEITQPDGNIIKFNILDKFGKIEKVPPVCAPNSKQLLRELIEKTIADNYGTEENAKLAFYEFLKSIPADQLINYNNHIDITYILPAINSAYMTSYVYPNIAFLAVSEDLPVLSHELGHAIDGENFEISSKNQELTNIYNQEMLQFKKDYPEYSQAFIAYFMQQGGSAGNGLSEFFAETNMLLTTYGQNIPVFTTRAEYLVRYFPKTIAEIAKILGYTN